MTTNLDRIIAEASPLPWILEGLQDFYSAPNARLIALLPHLIEVARRGAAWRQADVDSPLPLRASLWQDFTTALDSLEDAARE